MEIKRVRVDGKYAGSITTMSNGNKVVRDEHNHITMKYNASNGQVRDEHNHLIARKK